MEKDLFIIIDGNSLVNRAFYALPDLTNREGIHTNAVYGFINMLNKVIEEYRPKYLSVAFDMKAPTFRHREFEQYKAHRKKMPEELAEQIPILKEILDAMNINRIELPGFEADDLIGTVAKFYEREGLKVIIFTGDKDALQLVSDGIEVLITRKGITNLQIFNIEEVVKEYGIRPEQVTDFKGLVGDKSDNIPGVPGIGEKTATKLLQEFQSLENIIENVEQISNKSVREKIRENAEIAYLSKRLATIEVNVPIEINIEDFLFKEPDLDKLKELFIKYEFNSLIKRMIPEKNESIQEVAVKNIETKDRIVTTREEVKDLIDRILNKKFFVLTTFKKEEKNIRSDEILGISIILDDNNSYFIHIDKNPDLLVELKDILEDEGIKKYGHEMKKDVVALLLYGIRLKGLYFDSFIASYLLDPSRSSYKLSDIVYEYLEEKIITEEEFYGKGKDFKNNIELPLEELVKYGGIRTRSIFLLKDKMEEELNKNGLLKLFREIEMPLVEVLGNMEFEGVNIDKEVLEELGKEISVSIDEMTEKIFEVAGEEFNINSPKQLGEILFEKLKLPVLKKTKTGFSTSHETLEKLQNKHPIIPLIIDYRQLVKIKSTYVDGLYSLINPKTGKIHTNFNQTVTVTGRISSTEPNLQNIPIKYELGRRIRKIFIPSNEDYKLVDADYSQIELRVLAHMSGDEKLIEAFKNDMDIHTITASEVFDTPVDKVTPEERSRAKAVNFGIIYGISDFGLSESLRIPRKEAKRYIEQYFEKYRGVKEYMDMTVKRAKELGYVTTISDRRRYIPELQSNNFNIRSFGERTAMNTPIQGSAADIIKIAMIKVYNELASKSLKSKLILQVHDELIIDAHKDEIDEVKDILRRNMEKAVELKVPLKVDMKVGDSWYDTK